MTLGNVLKSPSVVWLAPRSGVQFLDLGFRLAGVRTLPDKWSFADEPSNDAPVIAARGEEQAKARVSYEIDWRRVTETFDRVWVPLPYFRREHGGRHDRGPANWARCHLVVLDQPDDNGFDHRLIVAFDTDLADEIAGQAYLAPTKEDSQRGSEFTLAASAQELGWFAGQAWIKEWCRTAFAEMILAEERARSNAEPDLDDAMLAERKEGQREEVARYMALIDMINQLRVLPGVRFIDRVTAPLPTPIDVDLVLDLGNSRTCGLLIETHPDELSADVTQAVKLNLRDLGQPELVYVDPFDSRVEFNRASFGWDDVSFLSGRADAFSWPTVARVGAEAARLSAGRRGSEGATGMSSPKRYLWDEDLRRDGWRYNTPGARDQAGYATGVEFTTLVNDAGEPLHTLPQSADGLDDRSFPSMRALYARSHLMSFALAEIFLQALCMMNSPAHRLRRRNADLPRRLNRIIMPMPTGMPLAERQLLIKRAEAARDLIYVCQRTAEIESDQAADQPVRAIEPDGVLPEILINWDEASATQATFLYSRIATGYSGDARAFFNDMRLPMPDGGRHPDEAFRLATLDIGGGTSDLVITSYRVEGQGGNVTLFPKPILREGISVAGDDIVRQIVIEHVLEPIETALKEAGLGERAEFVMHRLFGGDRGDMDVGDQIRRQRFAAHIGHPLALALIALYESWDRLQGPDRREPLAIEDALQDRFNRDLVEEIDAEIRRQGGGDFSLLDVRFPVDLREIDRTARSVMTDVMKAFAELVHRARADLLILSGRTSRMPAIFDTLIETCALPPHRILPLHQYRVGQWYPFRDFEAKIADPKTTAAVGAMICMLGEGRLRNFNYRSDHLKPQSTARYFGKLDIDSRLHSENVFYADMDLDDPDYELPDMPFEFRGPMSLGTRQFSADWWPGTRLYSIDYASPETATRLNARTPLKIELSRASERGHKGVVDAFTVRRVEDADGRTVPSREIRLRLQTIDQSDGFWLDTGVLLNT
ncbi:MAG: virulence factor SrfB [Geminicoccaceae bacterium]